MESLKKLNQWIVWRYEERPGEPKLAKVPYNPCVNHKRKKNWQPVKNDKGFITPEYSGGSMSNKSSTWGPYEAALKAMESGIFDGLGVMFANNLCGIDIDSCVKDGELTELAQDIMDTMDSYTEFSPSGTGIHILFYGQVNPGKEFYKKNPKNGVEIYSKTRYFTFTGRALNGKNVEERTAQVQQIQLKYMLREDKSKTSGAKNKSSGGLINLSDSEIIKIATMAKNGRAFQKLWSGDFSDYNSQSEADFALCNILSFYTGADESRIDCLFRQSGLYRDKWEREDYRNNTIRAAIESTREVYNPNHNRSTAYEDFFEETEEVDKDQKFFLVPKNKSNPALGLKVNVSLLAMYMKRKHDIKFYKGQFRIFKNNYYSFIENMKTMISNEIPEIYRIPSNIRDAEDLLAMDHELTLHDDELAPERYISFRNGILNVELMQFREYDNPITKKLIFINQIGFDYNPKAAPCKYTDNFFEDVTDGKQEDINFLYQVLGVLISGYRDFKNILYFTGKKDTGKSVFLHIAELLLTNPDGTRDFSNIGLRTLTDETSKEFTRIIGKRANICGESPSIRISNDTLLKQLSGGDTVAAQVKFKESVEFINRAMLIFSGNTIPSVFVSDKSSISERMLIYEFKKAIPKSNQIKNLEKKISIPYVIKRAVEQLKVFVENNQEFIVPEEIYFNREKMLIDSDTIYKFYRECVTVTEDPRDRVSNSDLYDAYIDFLVDEGHLRISKWDGRPDLSKFKITPYIFTAEMKRYHGQDKYKRNLIYKNSKADCFINMTLDKDKSTFKPTSDDEQKIIEGYFR